MAKDEKKDDMDALDSAIKKGDEETKDEIPQEVLDANKSFDDKIDSEQNTAIEEKKDESDEKDKPEDSEKEADEKKSAEEKTAEEEADEKDSGTEEAVEKTAEEKEIEAEAKVLEEQILADAGAKADAEVKAKADAEKKAKADAEKKAKAEKEAETDDEPYDCGLDPEEYDEGLIAQLNKQGQAVRDANKALKDENIELRGIIAQQGNQRYADWLDNKINGLGEDFHEVLGEGEIEDIEPGSVPYENRLKLASRMTLVSKTYQKLGKPVPSRTKLFNQAVSYLFSKQKNKSKTEAETKEKLAARAGQAIGGGSKKSSALSAEQIAANKIKAFDKKIDEE